MQLLLIDPAPNSQKKVAGVACAQWQAHACVPQACLLTCCAAFIDTPCQSVLRANQCGTANPANVHWTMGYRLRTMHPLPKQAQNPQEPHSQQPASSQRRVVARQIMLFDSSTSQAFGRNCCRSWKRRQPLQKKAALLGLVATHTAQQWYK